MPMIAFSSPKCGAGRPIQTADVAAVDAFIETLKARHAALKAQLTAAERVQDAQRAAEIAAEREKADKAFAELLRVADRSAALATERALPPWWWLAGYLPVANIHAAFSMAKRRVFP